MRILFVGRLVPEKGLDILFEVARKLTEHFPASFTIVGDGPLLDVAKQRASTIEGVEVIGRIEDKVRLSDLYREHDIFLLPSIRVAGWEELFGIVVIEAMASGLIVVASDHVGPSEIISDGVNGYLMQENDPAVIVERLRELQVNQDLAQSVSAAARAEALNYSVSAVASKWEEVLQSSDMPVTTVGSTAHQ
jgi:glycosyltransferase involved in cell wall biosynthesis